MNLSAEAMLMTIIVILFIIAMMLAVSIAYFLGRNSHDRKGDSRQIPFRDDYEEDIRLADLHHSEPPLLLKRSWLGGARNLILFLIIALMAGGGIYYYFLQKGVEVSIVEEKQADNPVGNPDEISASSPTSSSQDQKEEDPSKWGNYTNTTYNYTLRHPEEYSITTINDNVSAIKISPPESASLWLQVEVQSNPDQLASGAYASKFPPEGEVKQRANLIIAGIPSVRLEMQKESITYMANGLKVIIFKLPSANISDDQNQDLTNLKRIITTLKFK